MSMDTRKAIREDLESFKKERERLAERQAAIDVKVDALETALAALTGKLPGTGEPESDSNGKHRRTFKGRKSREEREHQVLDFIRNADGPVGASIIRYGSRDAGEEIPHSTAQAAINRLLAQGKVRQVGTTDRGQPLVEYVEAKLTPGEGLAHGKEN